MAAKKPPPKITETKVPPPPDVVVPIDPDELTLNEMIEVEDVLGVSFDTALRTGRSSVLRAIAFVKCRAADPDLTLEDVGGWKFSEVTWGE